MKRVICLIIVFMLYAVCASADRYLDASFSFSGLSDNRIETIDLYEQGDMITAVSTLIPEYAVIDDQSEYTLLSLFHSSKSAPLSMISSAASFTSVSKRP